MANSKVGSLGDYIKEQRRFAQFSLRQLAEVTGVSNPYLSQIERGLRKPSAEVLQQIAKALRISAEALYVRAGILEARESDRSDGDRSVAEALLSDSSITERQKRALLDIYELLRPHYARGQDEARALLREAFTLTGDLQIIGDTLHVRLDPATAPRRSRALAALCADLTDTQTRYPGTDLTLAYSVKNQPDPA